MYVCMYLWMYGCIHTDTQGRWSLFYNSFLYFLTEISIFHLFLILLTSLKWQFLLLQQKIFNWSFLLFWQGILSSVYLDERILNQWKMIPIPLNNLNEVPKTNPIFQVAYSEFTDVSAHRGAKGKNLVCSQIMIKKKLIHYSTHYFFFSSYHPWSFFL